MRPHPIYLSCPISLDADYTLLQRWYEEVTTFARDLCTLDCVTNLLEFVRPIESIEDFENLKKLWETRAYIIPLRDLRYLERVRDQKGVLLVNLSENLLELKPYGAKGTFMEMAICRYSLGIPVFVLSDISQILQDPWVLWASEGRLYSDLKRTLLDIIYLFD